MCALTKLVCWPSAIGVLNSVRAFKCAELICLSEEKWAFHVIFLCTAGDERTAQFLFACACYIHCDKKLLWEKNINAHTFS
jgi:hypothetical protein